MLAAVLLAAGLALALFLWTTRKAGGTVSVQVDGTVLMELSLNEETRIVLGEGENTNVLVIEHGTVRVAEASCPDQICVRQGEIQYEGESIVCLPHKLVIAIQGGTENGMDGVAG